MTLHFISTLFCEFKIIHDEQNKSLKKITQVFKASKFPASISEGSQLMRSGRIRLQFCVEDGLVTSANKLVPPTGTPREVACPLLAVAASGEVGNGDDFESERQ